MLPALKKPLNSQVQTSQIKTYNQQKQLYSIEPQNERKMSLMSSSRANTKTKVMTGYHKGQISCDGGGSKYRNNTSLKQSNYASLQQHNQTHTNNKLSNNNMAVKSTKDLSAQIKLIQRKIRYHKKKLQQDKKRKQQVQKNRSDPYNSDFEKIIKRQVQLQGGVYEQTRQQAVGFDYLTNPGKANQQQQEAQQAEVAQPQAQQPQRRRFQVVEKIQKLEKHYQNSLMKKFQRREMFPHYPCKRKAPKLYITQQNNALQKFGKRPTQQQHLFRIMTKQCTPQQIYPTIPNFAVVKDTLSRNVMAYLGDYRPFVERAKQQSGEEQAHTEIVDRTVKKQDADQNKTCP